MIIEGGQAYKDLINEGYISKSGKVLKSSTNNDHVNHCDKGGNGKASSIAKLIYKNRSNCRQIMFF